MKWRANYSDGSCLMQFDGDKENKYINIDRDRLASFVILNDSNKPILVVSIERPTQKLIYRKRVFHKPFSPQPDEIVHLVGWHENINGQSVKSICYLFQDGHIELAGAKDDIELISCEGG